MGNWDQQYGAMRMAIPILMQKKQHEEDLAMKQQQLDQAAMQLEQEKAEKEADLLSKVQESQIKFQQERLKAEESKMMEAYKQGDKEGVKAFGEPLRQMGIGVPAKQESLPEGVMGPPNLEWLAAPQKPEKQPEQWGEPTVDRFGNLVQKNLTTGKIDKVVGPNNRDSLFMDKIDLGDKVRAFKSETEFTDFPKTVSPNTIVTTDRRRATDEMGIRKEFQALPEVKVYPEIMSQVKRLDKAMEYAKSGKGSMVAVDQALITILNKMLDPSSVVRESEYARTPQDLAFLNRMQGKIEKLKTGGAGLTNEDRDAIYKMSQAFAEVAKGLYGQQVDYYTDLANRYGYEPKNIVRLGGAKEEYQTQPGTAGQYLQKFE